VTWFDCIFSHGQKKINLSTSPYKKQTHWKQTLFYTDKPFEVYPGDKITGNINVLKAKVNPRELDVYLEYQVNGNEKVSQYYRIS
jgi:protein arginine N-methyltransferase 1